MVGGLVQTEDEEWLRDQRDSESMLMANRPDPVLPDNEYLDVKDGSTALVVYAPGVLDGIDCEWLYHTYSELEISPAQSAPVGRRDERWMTIWIPEGSV